MSFLAVLFTSYSMQEYNYNKWFLKGRGYLPKGPPANKNLFAGDAPANKKLFTGCPLANKKLFSGSPLANKKLFAGGPLAYKKLFAQALSILCSPEWSYAVLSSFS